MSVKPIIHEAPSPIYQPKSNSDCHYGWHCGGFSLGHAHQVAHDIASMYVKSNSNTSAHATHYSVIELAVIPYSNSDNRYYVEDRSVKISNPLWEDLSL